MMNDDAVRILDSHRIMAIATIRPDGWPQTTIVGYVNDGLDFYFLIFRSSQKFANIQHDDRVSIAVGEEPREIGEAKAVYAGAHASEVTDPEQREHAWELLRQRHPNLADFELPERSASAMMRAECRYVSIVDYSKGLGHTEAMTIGDDGATTINAPRTDDWGKSAAHPKRSTPEKPDRTSDCKSLGN
jgi:nitroimidazol reductase NimA-like FMN-containing flavoprotein (pyridoxamine 5'-phosphate oxidase superfamily)